MNERVAGPTTGAMSATALAGAVASGAASAVEIVRATLADIEARDAKLNCFTGLTAERALAEAMALDARKRRGDRLPPLAGVPFAVKNLFDVEGVTTLAGSKINRDSPPARRDAAAVARLKAAGAILVGALNMDEYAYGFTTENTHYGPTRNPHDPTRIAGGSSGGSAAAVAGGLVPLSLGTDTNGSIRVPASLCGIFGLKPTYGRLSRAGAYLFAASFDHIGPFARSVADLAAAYDAMQGPDAADPVCANRMADPAVPHLARGIAGLRIARADGYFERYAGPDALEAVDAVSRALDAAKRVTIPDAARGRAAAFVITSSEGANLHLADLRTRPDDFDPLIRDRFLAGALVPSTWVLQAQRFRRHYRRQALEVFREADVVIAAATPVTAPPIGTETLEIGGETLPARPSMGLLTQPISCIGLPVLAVPVHRPGRLPIGVQLIAAPWNETLLFRVAAELERQGVVAASVARAT